MRILSTKEVKALEVDEVIISLRGTITKAYDRKIGGEGDKAWSVQNAFFKDQSGEIRIAFWNRDDIKDFVNKEVTLSCHHSDKGYSGLYAHDNDYKGKVTREIKAQSNADLRLATGEKPLETHVELEPGEATPGEFRKELVKVLNAFYLIEKGVATESAQNIVNGFTTTETHMQAKCSTAFIHLDRMGLVSQMPEIPLWSYAAQAAAKPAESEEEIPW